MKKILLVSVALLGLNAKADYPTVDFSQLQKILENHNISGDILGNLGQVKDLVDEHNLLIEATKSGNYMSALSVLSRVLDDYRELGTYPFLTNPTTGQEVDISEGRGASVIREQFYLERPTSGSSYVDDQNKVREIRQNAYDVALTRYNEAFAEYQQIIKDSQKRKADIRASFPSQPSLQDQELLEMSLDGENQVVQRAQAKTDAMAALVDITKKMLEDNRIYRDEFLAGS